MSTDTGTTERLRTTALHDRHVELGARMGPFAGWDMPVQYAGTIAEHEAVRSRVGVFDVSHLGTVWIEGPGALETVLATFTNDVRTLGVGMSQYTLCATPDGGIEDDLIVYHVGEDRFLAVPNAANAAAVVGALRESAQALDAGTAEVRDEHADWAILAVQGPESLSVLGQVVDTDPAEVPYLHCRELAVPGGTGLLCRTGYTGEVGAELVVPSAAALEVFDALLDAGAEACGLGARDTLRLEMGYPLHGSDLTAETTPYEARLGWAVKLDRGGFRGAEALRSARQRSAGQDRGPGRKLLGLRGSRRAIPRSGMRVAHAGEPAGEVTSGTFSPTLRIGIGLAYLDTRVTEGDAVTVDVRGRTETFDVVRPPFVDRNPRG